MTKLRSLSVLSLILLCQAAAFANDTICANTFITGTHENVIVPPGIICVSAVHIKGSVKVFGAYIAHAGTTVEGNIDGESGHLFVWLSGFQVLVLGNVQLKESASSEPSGYASGTEIRGDFKWEKNSNFLFAHGGTIGGNFVMEKSTGGGEIVGNGIQGNLICSENDLPPIGGDNSVGGNRDEECWGF